MTGAVRANIEGGLEELLGRIARAGNASVENAVSLPPEAYTSEELLEVERAKIFRNGWICVGRADEIESEGGYFTSQIDSVPVVVVRQPDGSIKSFANVCSHRSMQVASGKGRSKRFTCPYHGWTFGCDGRLLAAPFMADGFCKDGKGLSELATELVLGFIFVSLSNEPTKLATDLQHLVERLAPYQVERMRTLRKDTLTWNCNWKIAVENGIEPYHITSTHTSTLAPYAPVRNVVMEEGQYAYHAYDHRFDELVPIPSVPTYLPNTSNVDGIRGYAVAGCIFPNMAFSVAYDWMWWISCQPDGVGGVRVDHGVAGPFEINDDSPGIEDAAFDFLRIDTAFMPEDVPRVEGVQRGVRSGFARQSELSPLEGTIHGFIKYYAQQLKGL